MNKEPRTRDPKDSARGITTPSFDVKAILLWGTGLLLFVGGGLYLTQRELPPAPKAATVAPHCHFGELAMVVKDPVPDSGTDAASEPTKKADPTLIRVRTGNNPNSPPHTLKEFQAIPFAVTRVESFIIARMEGNDSDPNPTRAMIYYWESVSEKTPICLRRDEINKERAIIYRPDTTE